MRPVFNIIEFFYDHKLARDGLYWLSWIALVYFTHSLESWTYAGALLAGILLYIAGLLTGGALADEHYGSRP